MNFKHFLVLVLHKTKVLVFTRQSQEYAPKLSWSDEEIARRRWQLFPLRNSYLDDHQSGIVIPPAVMMAGMCSIATGKTMSKSIGC